MQMEDGEYKETSFEGDRWTRATLQQESPWCPPEMKLRKRSSYSDRTCTEVRHAKIYVNIIESESAFWLSTGQSSQNIGLGRQIIIIPMDV